MVGSRRARARDETPSEMAQGNDPQCFGCGAEPALSTSVSAGSELARQLDGVGVTSERHTV
eukprot:scaffold201763_cov30-Tisochrysis_lutea.AAC.3